MRAAALLLFALLAPPVVAAEDQLCGPASTPRPDPNARVEAWMSVDGGFVGLDAAENVVPEANPYCPGGPLAAAASTYATCIDPCTGVNVCTPATISAYPREIPVR